jgi:hypothetical protein
MAGPSQERPLTAAEAGAAAADAVLDAHPEIEQAVADAARARQDRQAQ